MKGIERTVVGGERGGEGGKIRRDERDKNKVRGRGEEG